MESGPPVERLVRGAELSSVLPAKKVWRVVSKLPQGGQSVGGRSNGGPVRGDRNAGATRLYIWVRLDLFRDVGSMSGFHEGGNDWAIYEYTL